MITVVDRDTLRRAVAGAIRAPSVYNSQPWRWRASSGDGVDLYADPNRHLITTDPQGRDLLLSCGAALHHLTVAFAELGWSSQITRLDDPNNLHHLAHIQLHTGADPNSARLGPAIHRRHTDRRRFSPDPVPTTLLDTLIEQAAPHGAHLRVVESSTARAHLIAIITESASLQQQQLGYAAEVAQWTSRHAQSGDGIQSESTVAPGVGLPGEIPMRPSPRPLLDQPPHSFQHQDASVLMVLSTASDERLAVLRAGEAMSAILLTATHHGLATTPLSQPLEIAQTRTAISAHILGAERYAQLILRIGWPHPDSPELPPSPRRRLDYVLELAHR